MKRMPSNEAKKREKNNANNEPLKLKSTLKVEQFVRIAFAMSLWMNFELRNPFCLREKNLSDESHYADGSLKYYTFWVYIYQRLSINLNCNFWLYYISFAVSIHIRRTRNGKDQRQSTPLLWAAVLFFRKKLPFDFFSFQILLGESLFS